MEIDDPRQHPRPRCIKYRSVAMSALCVAAGCTNPVVIPTQTPRHNRLAARPQNRTAIDATNHHLPKLQPARKRRPSLGNQSQAGPKLAQPIPSHTIHQDAVASAAMSSETDPVGYDVEAVNAWVRHNVADLAPPFTWTRLEGGHSNLTYLIVDTAGTEAVIRRPPMGKLLPKAHDMDREYRVINALQDTAVPVPKAYGYCGDESVIGKHFFIMGRSPGTALFSTEIAADYLTEEAAGNVCASYTQTLAALHAVEPADVGLEELGRHDGYVARQLRTWYGSWNASIEAAQYDDPRVHRIHDELMASLPDQGPARVVHGDCGLHNCLIAPDGTISAILDWEIATLGDPVADFAYALNAWIRPEDEYKPITTAPSLAPGFSSRQELIDSYKEASGRDLEGLDYYVAFNHLKTACIVHGVYARYMQGQKSTEGIDMDALNHRFRAAIDLAEQAL